MDSRVQLKHIRNQIIIFPPRVINPKFPWLNAYTNIRLPSKIRTIVFEVVNYILNNYYWRIIGKKW